MSDASLGRRLRVLTMDVRGSPKWGQLGSKIGQVYDLKVSFSTVHYGLLSQNVLILIL